MKKKNTAHRPSQSNQQYVKNIRGEKVLNTAYKENNCTIIDISVVNSFRDDFDIDSSDNQETPHDILRHTTDIADYVDNIIEAYPLRENNSFDMTILDKFDDIFKDDNNQNYKELSQQFVNFVENNSLLYSDVGSAKTIYTCILDGHELYDEHYKLFYNRYKNAYDDNPELFKASFVKNCFDSRGTGQDFGNYIKTLKESVQLDDLKEHDGVCITIGNNNSSSDKRLKKYCEKNFGISLDKGIDAIGKGKSGKYYIFEAKYITTRGGGQNHQVRNALDISLISNDKCQGVAVLDGNFIIRNNYPMIRDVFSNIEDSKYNSEYVISATEIIEFLSNN